MASVATVEPGGATLISATVIAAVAPLVRLMFCGDFRQSDLTREQERNGLTRFIRIIKGMSGISYVEFEKEDIVRSRFVREYIVAKDKYETAVTRGVAEQPVTD